MHRLCEVDDAELKGLDGTIVYSNNFDHWEYNAMIYITQLIYIKEEMQDVFYQFIGNTEPIEQLTSWLFTVTRNKIVDRQRKHKSDLIEDIYATTDDEESLNWNELFFDSNDNPQLVFLSL